MLRFVIAWLMAATVGAEMIIVTPTGQVSSMTRTTNGPVCAAALTGVYTRAGVTVPVAFTADFTNQTLASSAYLAEGLHAAAVADAAARGWTGDTVLVVFDWYDLDEYPLGPVPVRYQAGYWSFNNTNDFVTANDPYQQLTLHTPITRTMNGTTAGLRAGFSAGRSGALTGDQAMEIAGMAWQPRTLAVAIYRSEHEAPRNFAAETWDGACWTLCDVRRVSSLRWEWIEFDLTAAAADTGRVRIRGFEPYREPTMEKPGWWAVDNLTME